MDEMMMISALN